MVPLRTNRQVLTWLCVYPSEEGDSKLMKLAHISFTLTILAVNLLAFGISMYSFIHLVNTNLEASLLCLLQMVAEMSAIYIIVITVYNRRDISAIFTTLTKIYGTRKCIIIITLIR